MNFRSVSTMLRHWSLHHRLQTLKKVSGSFLWKSEKVEFQARYEPGCFSLASWSGQKHQDSIRSKEHFSCFYSSSQQKKVVVKLLRHPKRARVQGPKAWCAEELLVWPWRPTFQPKQTRGRTTLDFSSPSWAGAFIDWPEPSMLSLFYHWDLARAIGSHKLGIDRSLAF